ncbi:XRE family transcriptional regulator [Streptomyces sp. NPDC058045]|uniref:XRE family transcriptional regulator n=1 Tax=Streptomyces sp. NPDC058045 TaxID=3346311 RepID=UPI0036EDEB0E
MSPYDPLSGPPPDTPRPLFDAAAARRLRLALGMEPGHVAHGVRASYGMPWVDAATVLDWEEGHSSPTAAELTALAGALWCAPGELLGAAGTLREHRLARGLAPEDVALASGVSIQDYLRMEEEGQWRGSDRQSTALADVLALTPREFAHVTGRDEELTRLLHSAVTTRWQAYVRPVVKLLPLPRRQVAQALERLYQDYQTGMAGTLSWVGGAAQARAREAGQDFLDGILDRFWRLAEPDSPSDGPSHLRP